MIIDLLNKGENLMGSRGSSKQVQRVAKSRLEGKLETYLQKGKQGCGLDCETGNDTPTRGSLFTIPFARGFNLLQADMRGISSLD